MKKLIKLEFNNTTRERKTEDSYSELYSYDKNNGSFEFEILNETLTTEQVTALFKFTESNKIWKTTGTVEGNKVNVTFDTNLITQNETVICYLYFDEEQRTSDTFRFKFKVKVSEIDKMNRYEVKERFINNTVIVDRLDVVTKDELKEALKNVGGIATEGLLTETKAEETYAKKTDAVDNTNFELVKNRVLALELKTDKDTVYDDSEVKERLTTLENKAPVDLSGYATKEELRNVSGSQPLADNLVTKQELEEKQYLTTHQDLSEYAKKSELYNDSDLKARVEVLEQKTDKDTVYDDTPLKERVTALESRAIEGGTYDDKPIRDRLDVLEAKHDNDTIYDDTEVKRRLTEIESKPAIDTSVFVTEEELNNKAYLTQHQPLDNLVTKEELNSKGYVTNEALNSKGYLTEYQNISHLVTNDELNSKGYLTEEVLNSKNYLTEDVLNTKNYLTQHQDLSSLVTKQELENKHYLTEHQPLTHLATTSDLEVLRNIAVSKSELSSKVDNTEFNTFKDNVVTKTELSEKGYLTTHQDLSEYALKSELYNDTDLKNRVETLENRSNNDTAYDDTDLKRRVSELEQRPDNNIVYDDRDLRERVEALENKPSGGQTQDTGWLKVSGENAIAENIVEIRRIGNTVHVRFRNEKNGDFIIVENIYSILDKEISGGFGSITNNSPIFSSKNNRELGRIITNVSNNRITVESSIDIELSGSKSVYINEFSYITDEPFPTNLH